MYRQLKVIEYVSSIQVIECVVTINCLRVTVPACLRIVLNFICGKTKMSTRYSIPKFSEFYHLLKFSDEICWWKIPIVCRLMLCALLIRSQGNSLFNRIGLYTYSRRITSKNVSLTEDIILTYWGPVDLSRPVVVHLPQYFSYPPQYFSSIFGYPSQYFF